MAWSSSVVSLVWKKKWRWLSWLWLILVLESRFDTYVQLELHVALTCSLSIHNICTVYMWAKSLLIFLTERQHIPGWLQTFGWSESKHHQWEEAVLDGSAGAFAQNTWRWADASCYSGEISSQISHQLEYLHAQVIKMFLQWWYLSLTGWQ